MELADDCIGNKLIVNSNINIGIKAKALTSGQTVSDCAINDAICPQGMVTALSPRYASTADGIPSVYSVALVIRRYAGVSSIFLITDGGDLYVRGYVGDVQIGWSDWRRVQLNAL